jgi:3-dehydroquinate synthase
MISFAGFFYHLSKSFPMHQSVSFTTDLVQEINNHIASLKPDSAFFLVDSNTRKNCLPVVQSDSELASLPVIEIKAGDDHKNLHTLSDVWTALCEQGATRKSLLINLGGGMVTDLGGFAASTFKRGIAYINIPTTLLGTVDAATGGKTGINFNGLKNEIGVIRPAEAVLLYAPFFKTLDRSNLLSGYAEMLKHALLKSEDEWKAVITFDFECTDYNRLGELTLRSVTIKESVVGQDPTEQNIRKALNLGHTFGHAFESFSYKNGHPLLHGYAVAFGLICELYLSYRQLNFPQAVLSQLIQTVKNNYGVTCFSCNDYDTLYELMTHDKKNDADGINFTLLASIGDIRINQHASQKEIFGAFDFLADSLGF